MSASFLEHSRKNSVQCCQVQGCGYFRANLSLWCSKHLPRARSYGHPLADALSPSLWKTQRTEVSTLLEQHAGHRGLQQALAILQVWMQQAAESESAFKGAREIGQLVRRGVTPLRLLTELCAHWLWVSDFGHRFPSDRAQDFAISRAVFALAPRPRVATKGTRSSGTWGLPTNTAKSWSTKPLASGLAHVGLHLRKVMGPMLVSVSAAIEEQRKLAAEPQALMRLPFPVAALTAAAHR